MSAKITIPVTDAAARPQVVTDHFKLADALQLALIQLGDGFFPLEGFVVGGPLNGRSYKSLNGEVIAGTGLTVSVRDPLALVDGALLTGKNKEQFAPTDLTSVTVPANATSYIILRAARVTGTDGADRPDISTGALTAEANPPAARSGILLAKLIVPSGATQVTSGMITDMRSYLSNMNELQAIEDTIATLHAQGGSDLDSTIRIAQTNFKVDTALSIATNALLNGWVEVFTDGSDIDTGLSSSYSVSPALKVVTASGPTAANLVNYWKFDEPNGAGPVLLDSVGGSNGLFITEGGSPVAARDAGVIGNAISPLANMARGVLGTGLIDYTNSDWTIIAWGLKDNNGGDRSIISTRINADGSDAAYSAQPGYINFGTLGTTLYAEATYSIGGNANFQYQGEIAGTIPDGWNQYAITWTAASRVIKFYLNGVQVQTYTLPVGAYIGGAASTLNMGLWAAQNNGVFYWSGQIDEVTLFSAALDAATLLGLHSTVAPVTGSFTPGVVVSKAHVAAAPPTSIMLLAEGTNDLTLSVSRDNGTTWTAATSGALTDVSGQPSGTQVRYKVGLPAVSSKLDNIAVFWK